MKKFLLVLIVAVFLATSVTVIGVNLLPSDNEIKAPEYIWTYNQYKANTHTHTTRSLDSSTFPQDRVYEYQDRGYDILALSDHYLGLKSFEEAGITDYYLTPICSNEGEGVMAHINIYYT
ncbi:MAG: hypothetical protein J6R44_01345, partial [Clostridia bacterium]|nr:hypothetical protein [Clostridia bacterium]